MLMIIHPIQQAIIAHYADYNTPYSANNNIVDILSNLKLQSNILNKWFKDNYMKANSSTFKCNRRNKYTKY